MYTTTGLTVFALLLVVLRERDLRRLERLHADHAAQIEAVYASTAAQLALVLDQTASERRSLLDRIQHPRVLQPPPVLDATQPVEPDAHEPPLRDELELAYIGGEVPQGVSVGSVGAEARGDNAS